MTTDSSPAPPHSVTFGIKTSPIHVAYADVLRVWREADAIPEIAHSWLFDHLLPIYGDPSGPMLEGWTLLAALAAQTERLGLGLIVTSNRFRPPALLAKIAATTDVISGGRLTLGIGVGSAPGHPAARREYDAHDIPLIAHRDADSLQEACTIITRLWTEDDPFDFDGAHHHLRGAHCNPKPAQAPRPPILIGGWGERTLRVVARHADIWNLPGAPLNDADELLRRSQMLDEACAEVGRDPRTIERSVQIGVDYDDLPRTLADVATAMQTGFTHIVLALPAPYPDRIAQAIRDEVIAPAVHRVASDAG
ncbi:MAG: LLM class flavin-dependent oxidoreductase [Actinomycetota bacterium]|nr:LLM class flavin-dependent oxidoreductase [Actinomycetota bacterium]